MAEQSNTILIVEDDEDISEVLAIRLKEAGFQVHRVFDAVLAMDAAKNSGAALAILDITMPGGNGIDLAHRMRAQPETADIPVVFLTASKRPDLLERAEEVGAAAVFEKPFDGKALVATVRALLGMGATAL